MCVWQPLFHDAKSLSRDFYYGKKIEQRVCLKLCVYNRITATESSKMLQKCFGESTLSRTQVFEWHKAFSEGRGVVENLPHESRPSTSFNDDNIEKVKKIVFYTEKNLAQMLLLAVELLRLAEESCATMHLGMLRSLCG